MAETHRFPAAEASGYAPVEQALTWLEEGQRMNPGPWYAHSLHVGEAARRIADAVGLDTERAHSLGLLHDIGRRFGKTGMRHSYDGWRFLIEQGCPHNARIAISHSFPILDMESAFGVWDCEEAEMTAIQDLIESMQLDDYDRLIQLCDALAIESGVVLMEKRMLDVALRHGVTETTVSKWQATFAIKDDFERRLGHSLYQLFPEAVANTFT